MSYEHPNPGLLVSAAYDEATAAAEKLRPSYIWRPHLAKDGNSWIALFGDNLAEGVVGCGDSPDEAMRDFDKAWYRSAKVKP